MDPRVLIISGSARSYGHCGWMVSRLVEGIGGHAEVIDLSGLAIGRYVYGGAFDRDDFGAVTAALLAHRRIVLATPVYWYAMSGLMKTMFDRLTDLLSRPEGRALAGRQLWLAAIGSDPALPEGFEVPFARTAAWLDMDWRGASYLAMDGDRPNESDLAPLDALVCDLRG